MLCHVVWSQVEYKIICFIYLSTMGGAFSTVGDIMSTVGDILSSMGNTEYREGYHVASHAALRGIS